MMEKTEGRSMWKVVLALVAILSVFLAVRANNQARFEREATERRIAELEEQVRTTKRNTAPQAGVPTDDEFKEAAKKVLGDLVEPEPKAYEVHGEPAIPVVREPELRVTSDVSWNVTERNDIWHRVSYSITLRSAVNRTLTVDVKVKALTSSALPLDDDMHRNIVLPADGRMVVLADYMLVHCPACFQVFTVGGDINIKAAQ